MSQDPNDWLARVDGEPWDDAAAYNGGHSASEAAEKAAEIAYSSDPGSWTSHHIDVDVRRRRSETVFRYRVMIDFSPDFTAVERHGTVHKAHFPGCERQP